MTYRYYHIIRPPMISCQPDGFTDKGFLEGASTFGKVAVTLASGATYEAFGWAEYAEPLTFEQCFHFDLMPNDPMEWAKFQVWLYCDRHEDRANRMIESYQGEATVEMLREYYREGSYILTAWMILLNQEVA